jgi:glycosyltransferase involved in cell wall biosynthesis
MCIARDEGGIMKIVIAALSAPCSLNGVSRHAANLARGLLSLEDTPEVHFVAGEWQREMFPAAIARNDSHCHIHWIPIRHSNVSRIAWYYRDLPSIAAQLEAEVVHFACPAPVRAGAYKCPTVVSLHDLYPFDIPINFGRLRSEITRQLMRQCLMKIDAIACVSAYTQSRLAQWFPPEVSRKAVTIPNAVEPLSGDADARELPGEGKPFVLCIAQHRQNKNVPLALRIFAAAVRAGILPMDTGFLILGIDGPETRKIKKAIRELHLEKEVMLMNGISDQQLLWCYRNCSLLLAPSSIEGFGLPVAEALIAGCPVVCSDIPPFREVGGDRCRYVAFGAGMMEGYLDAISRTVAEPRPAAVLFPELAPASIAGRYMELYGRLRGFPAVSQNGILLHPDSETRKRRVSAV